MRDFDRILADCMTADDVGQAERLLQELTELAKGPGYTPSDYSEVRRAMNLRILQAAEHRCGATRDRVYSLFQRFTPDAKVIPIRCEPVGVTDGPSEVEIAGWREKARQDPDWAARQIWGLLHRAIQAERFAENIERMARNNLSHVSDLLRSALDGVRDAKGKPE